MIKSIYLWILALLFLVISHITIRNIGGSLVLPTAYFIWVTASGLILLAVIRVFNEWRLVIPRVALYIFIFLLLLLQSVIFNPIIDSHSFIFETAGLIGGIIFFISLHQFELTDEQKERIIYVIFLSGLIEALISLYQYLNPETGIFLIVAPAAKKIYGNFQHQNILASYLATNIVISLYILTGDIFKGMSRWLKGLFYLSVLLMTFILLLTGSRAGLIEAGIGVFILTAVRFRHYRVMPLYPAIWLIMIAVGTAGSVASEKYYYERESALASVGHKLENAVDSIAGEEIKDVRVPVYLSTIDMIKDRPLTGHGVGNFSSRFMHYRGRLARDNPEYPYEEVFTTHPHNELLYRTAESGLPGGAGLLMVAAVFTIFLFRLGKEKGGTYAAFLFPIAFDTQVSYALYQSMPHLMLFIFLLYLPSAYFIKEVRIKPVGLLKKAVLTAAATLFILIIYFSVITVNAQIKVRKYQEMLIMGVVRPDLLEPAVNNIYLKQLGRRLHFDADFRMGLLRNDLKLINGFADFLIKEKEVFPHPDVFERGSVALYIVGRKEEAYKLLEEGLYLYPGRAGMIKVKQDFNSADARERSMH